MRWFSAEVSLRVAAIMGAFAVIAGAFGGHALDRLLSPSDMAVYQTAVKYHFWHTLALLALGFGQIRHDNVWLQRSASLFALGIVLFCGSLYLLALSGVRSLGIITPFGGFAFIVGWLCILPAVKKKG
jgi:uncharacterized membrane protein YgdD (TMEM256/DUF423 family)